MSDLYHFLTRQLQLVGDRAPLTILDETPHRLAAMVEGVEARLLDTRPGPARWSPNEIVAHLADMEWVFGYRIRNIRSDEAVQLHHIDQEAWVEKPQVNSTPMAVHLQHFAAARQVNVAFWQSLRPDEWAREGYHTGAKRMMSLAFLHRLQAGHDLAHLEQLERTLAVLTTREA